MERWEMLNRALIPVDLVMGLGMDALRATGAYEPFRNGLIEATRKFMRHNFRTNNDLEVIGEENLPATGGCIVAANHQSWLDVQVLAACERRRYYFVAKRDFLHFPVLRRMIDLTDGIYVQRGGDNAALEKIAEAIREGKAVVIFPEGTIPGEEDIPRWDVEPDTGLLRGHSGVVRLALMTGAPIIPVGLSGTGASLPPEIYPRLQVWPPLPRNQKITVRYGKPMFIAPPEGGVTREFLADRTHDVMLAISRLVDHERGYEPIRVPVQEKREPDRLPRMAYSRSQKKSAGKSKAPLGVLVLHGFTSDIHCVDPLVAPLDEVGLPYRFPILRGHGTVWQDLEGVKARDWYEDAENAYLDLLKEVESVLVIGLSMGGLVALELAARHRKDTAGVVAVAAALKFVDPLAPMAPALSLFIKSWPSPDAYNDKACRDRENRNYPKFPTAAFGELLAYSRRVPDILSFVKAPVLILHSHKDQVISPSSAELIYEKVSSKDRSIIWFDRSGHEMFLDLEADLVIKEVMRFVRKIAG